MQAIANNQVLYADGNEEACQCSIAPHCRLGSSLVIPIAGEDNSVIGAIKLYEPKTRLFSTINRTLGEGIAKLLSSQILAGRYEQQKVLLAQSEIKLLHAQVNSSPVTEITETPAVLEATYSTASILSSRTWCCPKQGIWRSWLAPASTPTFCGARSRRRRWRVFSKRAGLMGLSR